MTTNDNPVEALRAVYEAATGGKWLPTVSTSSDETGEHYTCVGVTVPSKRGLALFIGDDDPEQDVDNARAIAATHNVMPELLAVVEAADNAVWRYGESGESDDRAHQALDNALDALRAKIREVLR